MSKYTRKTEDEFEIMAYYDAGTGWEVVDVIAYDFLRGVAHD